MIMIDLLILVGFVVIIIDLICTLRGKPLIKPGPLAKFMHPGLESEDD